MPLELPAPFDQPAGAWTHYGRRYVALTIPEPGTLHRNDYEIAWIEVAELAGWSGEARSVTATRRRPGSDARCSFTDAATRSIERTLLPLVNRYGFHRWWSEWLAARADRETVASTDLAVDLDRRARWQRDRADLWSLLEAGRLDIVAAPAPTHRDERRVLILDPTNRVTFETVAAEVKLDGGTVGYYTREGHLVPLDHDLRLR